MNDINFSTPNGFPLEADATLGFMQSDYRRAIEAMAIFVSEGKNVILSGVNYYQSAGQTYYSEGWVVTQYGQLMRFVGGVAQTTCCLEETIVQKPNADGTLVSRYYTRRMVFGAGALQVNFSDFKRIEGNNSLTNALQGIVGFESAVILRGCDVFNLDTNASTLEITEGLAMIEGRLFTVPTYSGAYPVYFDMANGITNWTTNTVGLQLSAIAFDPYTSQYYADVTKRKLTPKDEIKTIVALSTMFDGTGLGRHSWKGFALCNGENGTVDLRGRTIFGYDERTVDPVNLIWDNTYNSPQNTGGQKSQQLGIANLPEHGHAPFNSGYLKRSGSTEVNTTPTGWDSIGAGTEMNIKSYETENFVGQNQAFDIRPPFMTVVFVQKL